MHSGVRSLLRCQSLQNAGGCYRRVHAIPVEFRPDCDVPVWRQRVAVPALHWHEHLAQRDRVPCPLCERAPHPRGLTGGAGAQPHNRGPEHPPTNNKNHDQCAANQLYPGLFVLFLPQ